MRCNYVFTGCLLQRVSLNFYLFSYACMISLQHTCIIVLSTVIYFQNVYCFLMAMISSIMEQSSPCTGEDNPKGSPMRKLAKRVQTLCLEVTLMNASFTFSCTVTLYTTELMGANPFCFFVVSMMNPWGRFLLYRVTVWVWRTILVIFACMNP